MNYCVDNVEEAVREILRQHDLVYEAAPLEWEQGIPLGNGTLGVVIWGDGCPLKFSLSRADIWERRHVDWFSDPRFNYRTLRKLLEEGRFSEVKYVFEDRLYRDPYPTRLPAGRAVLDLNEKCEKFCARLHLYDAFVEGEISYGKGSVVFSAFVHSLVNVFVLKFSFRGGVANFLFDVVPPPFDEESSGKLEKWGYPPPVRGSSGEFKWIFFEVPESCKYCIAWTLKRENEDTYIVFLTISCRKEGNVVEEALETLRKIVDRSFEELFEEHKAWWHEFWSKSAIVIPDPLLENLYYVELYKLACNSRPGGLPVTLQGVWLRDDRLPPWSSDYHLDMNVEMSYWPIYASNNLELGEPLYEMFWKLLPRFKEFCRKFYGWDGAMAVCALSDEGDPIPGWHTVNLWPGNGAWIAHLFWLHYLYSLDKEFLREKAYPFMKEFFKFYRGLLEEGADSYLHIPWSTSPEWKDNRREAWGRDPTCDLALIRFLCRALLEAVKELNISDSDKEEYERVLEKLAPYLYSDKELGGGLLIMDGVPLTESHRHHSHLMPIHPLGLITVEGGDREKRIIELSLKTLIWRGFGEWTGWSYPWASLIASRAGYGTMAYTMLKLYLTAFVSENSFHLNGDYKRRGLSIHTYKPMTLEGGFGAAAAILEMLLQSWNKTIRVFPAVPDSWRDAYFYNLRAEGAFLVTSKLSAGKVKYVFIVSEKGGECRVKNPFKGKRVVLLDVNEKKEKLLEGEILVFETRPDASYLLYAEGEKPHFSDLNIPVTSRKPNETNWFGVKLRKKLFN